MFGYTEGHKITERWKNEKQKKIKQKVPEEDLCGIYTKGERESCATERKVYKNEEQRMKCQLSLTASLGSAGPIPKNLVNLQSILMSQVERAFQRE